MKRIRYWFTRKKVLMAQAKDLARQLQEAWDMEKYCKEKMRKWGRLYYYEREKSRGLTEQLHRVARERDEERRLRLEAEQWAKAVEGGAKKMLAFKRLLELEGSEEELEQAAEELRDTYLEDEEE